MQKQSFIFSRDSTWPPSDKDLSDWGWFTAHMATALHARCLVTDRIPINLEVTAKSHLSFELCLMILVCSQHPFWT